MLWGDYWNSRSICSRAVVLQTDSQEGPTKAIAESIKPSLRTFAVMTFIRSRSTRWIWERISSESIKRSPDKNTSEALKRVPGLSIQEGRYLVVRGLSDRYNQAMLNGVLLSSTEPDRKTFSFDIFPNPVHDYLTLALSTTSKTEIKIVNMLGQIEYYTTAIGQKINIDVSSLASGVHFIQVTADDKISRRKFIRE